MEVKNVSETPFLFGFAPPSAESEIPSGEFAAVLAGIGESRTPLSTMAEAVGLEPNAPLQKLDSPELRQGEVDRNLVPQLHEVKQSFVIQPDGEGFFSIAAAIQEGIAVVKAAPSSPVLLNDSASASSIEDGALVDGLVLQESDAILDRIDLQFLIEKELARQLPSELNASEPVVRGPVSLPESFLKTSNQEATFEKDSVQASLNLQSIKEFRGVAAEIAGGIQRVQRTFENLRQLFGSENEKAKVQGADVPFFEQVRRISGLTGPLPRVDLNLPTISGGTPMILQPALDHEGKSLPDVKSLELNLLPGTKSTFAQVSEALGVIGISISHETTFEQNSSPTPLIELPVDAGELPESKILSRALDLRAQLESSSTLKPSHLSTPEIEQVESLEVEPIPVEALPDSVFNELSNSPDSVKKAIAHTWAVLEKTARKGLDTVPHQGSLDAKSYAVAGTAPAALNPKGTVPRRSEPVVTGANLRLAHSSSQVLQNANLVAPVSHQEISQDHPFADQLSPTKAVTPFRTESDGVVLGKESQVQVAAQSTLAVQPGVINSKPKDVPDKVSDGRLAIEGNHSLLEIRSETVRKVAEHLDRLLVTRSKSESVIRMQPDELGSITLVVRNVKNDIEAVVTASDERVRELLNDSRQDLVHHLQQKGHSEVRVTVAAEANSGDRQPSHRDASQGDHGQRHSGNSDFGSSSNGQSFSRDQGQQSQHGQQGSNASRAFRSEDDRSLQPELAPSKKSETFRRFQKVIDVAI